MSTPVILIDYENVQKLDLKPLLNQDVLVKVFHNGNQKFASDFTTLAIQLGKGKIELIKIAGTGKNALDFHIAYFMGKLIKEIENPHFYIISKDTGFKPLVEFVNHEEKVSCSIGPSIPDFGVVKAAIPRAIKASLPKTNDDWYKLVCKMLSNPRIPRPKKKTTLHNQIINFCKKAIDDSQANAIMQMLIDNKVIECSNELVIYRKV